MRKRLSSVLVAAALLAALRPIASAQPPADAGLHSSSAPTLVGAWSIDVAPTLVPAFTSLGTFSADGTLTNISSPSLGFPPESPGYGEWVRVGRHGFAITFHTLMGDGAGESRRKAKSPGNAYRGPQKRTGERRLSS